MKVALVLFDWFPHGGLQRDCLRIGLGLMKQGVAVDVICMTWEGPVPEGITRVMPAISLPGNILIRNLFSSKVAKRKAFAQFVAQQKARENYDAVLGFNRVPGLDYYFAADTCFAWKATRERNYLYRLSSRSRQYLQFEESVFDEQSKAKILILSPGQKNEYLACYPASAARIIDIPPGIERNRMAGEDADDLRHSLRHEFGLADDQLLVLQVGSGFPIKGVDRSLAALASLPAELKKKTRMFIIGRDKPGRYEKMAQQLGIAAKVTFFKSRDDLPRFFQGADLLLHPSYKESAGMVILEAIVAGLPVLTTAACGYAFHVEQAKAGIVVADPFSQNALNENFRAMLDSDEKSQWKDAGIRYGKNADLYEMPETVASFIAEDIAVNNAARMQEESHVS
jgi:UDP-glucose:(heptosyl)LPS alpha-1,3-glucosyltransferase